MMRLRASLNFTSASAQVCRKSGAEVGFLLLSQKHLSFHIGLSYSHINILAPLKLVAVFPNQTLIAAVVSSEEGFGIASLCNY